MLPCLAPMLLEVMMGYLTGDLKGREEFARNVVNPQRRDIGTSKDLASPPLWFHDNLAHYKEAPAWGEYPPLAGNECGTQPWCSF